MVITEREMRDRFVRNSIACMMQGTAASCVRLQPQHTLSAGEGKARERGGVEEEMGGGSDRRWWCVMPRPARSAGRNESDREL